MRYFSLILSLVVSVSCSSRKIAPILECYSCMSYEYHKYWDALKIIYERPYSFTNGCNKEFKKRSVGTVDCPDVCVMLIERNIKKDSKKAPDLYIRGCLDTILHDGFNRSAIVKNGLYNYDTCRTLPRSQLFAHPDPTIRFTGHVRICSCSNDKCNRADLVISTPFSLIFLVIFASYSQ